MMTGPEYARLITPLIDWIASDRVMFHSMFEFTAAAVLIAVLICDKLSEACLLVAMGFVVGGLAPLVAIALLAVWPILMMVGVGILALWGCIKLRKRLFGAVKT
jgi:vacuolar-type H+-ATPase subunit I/STV1